MAATQKKKQQEAPAPQVEARIDRMVDGDYKTKAYASVTIAGAFAVHGPVSYTHLDVYKRQGPSRA